MNEGQSQLVTWIARDSPVVTYRSALTVFVFSFVILFGVTFIWTANRTTSIKSPPAPWNTDGVFYDNIAFSLSKGAGFSVDLEDEAWRGPYVEANKRSGPNQIYHWLFQAQLRGPTALRSPLYPYFLAGIFKVFGHRYDVARILGCVFVSFGCALLLSFSARRWGLVAACVSGATLMVDYSVMQAAGTLATESLAILVFAASFFLVSRAFEKPTVLNWCIAGIAFASLLLTRGIWNLGLLLLVGLTLSYAIPKVRKTLAIDFRHWLAFIATVVVFAAPWWVRNCRATGHFTPFGTAGACGFVAAYCDESLMDFGQWQPAVYRQNEAAVQATVDMDTILLADLEYQIGQKSLQKTKQWISGNWHRVPELMLYRAISHWGFFNRTVPTFFQLANAILITIGIVGCVCCTGRLRSLFVFVFVLDSLLVMLTWEHLGRYAIPIRPLVHVGYGIAVSILIHKVVEQYKINNPNS